MDTLPTTISELVSMAEAEHNRIKRQVNEVGMLLEQSQSEVERLAKRNQTIGGRLKVLEQNLDTVPRSDIKATYDAAMDAQQRLFTMRGQLEKLQADYDNMKRIAEILEAVLNVLGQDVAEALPGGGLSRTNQAASAEAKETVLRIIEAQENERQRLSNAMHDGPAQSLTNFILQAEIAQRLFDSDPERARSELLHLKGAASSVFQKVREFISELRPMMLSDLGLIPTARRYVTTFGDQAKDLTVNLYVHGEERRFEPHREVVAFRGLQELMDNARRHAEASNLQVTLDVDEYTCTITVQDDGKGFDADELFNGRLTNRKTLGLATLKERVEMLGGQLTFDNNMGAGTKATIEIPIQTLD